jgi:hypothetical protein
VAYLQHFLPEILDVDDFLSLGRLGVVSEEPFDFFLGLRLLGLLADTNRPFVVGDILPPLARQILKFESIPSQIEREFSRAFAIGRLMPVADFEAFAIATANEFTTRICPVLASNIVSLIGFFNLWSLVDSRFAGNLDLSAVGGWHLIANALSAMPSGRRFQYVTEDPAISLLPSLFTSIYQDRRKHSADLVLLFSTFPTAAMSWVASPSVPTAVRQFADEFASGNLAPSIFREISDRLQKLRLESTTINVETRQRRVYAVYTADAASYPIKLALTFPANYPFTPVVVKCEFGNEGRTCAHRVDGAIRRSQSIEAGIVTWHQFITQRLVEGEPCTVCYSYMSDDMKKPKIPCPTCHQKFHGKCLSKWFSTLLKPTCPYCSSAWEEKKKKST